MAAVGARMGNLDVVLEPVDTIPRSASGKSPAVISNSNEVRGASR